VANSLAPVDAVEPATQPAPLWRKRSARIAVAIAIALGVLAVGAAISWHFSDQVLVPDHSGWPEDVEVEAVSPRSVTLERSDETTRPGFFGLTWQGGHVVAGPLVASDKDSVTRRLRDVDGYLVPGLKVGIDWNVFAGNPRSALGLPFTRVPIASELGAMPAWLIPGRSRTWAIVVHGINSSPQTDLRIAPALHRAELPSLLISYRDDAGAPSSPDGFHHMGLTEWRDLQAAARYALAHGARRLLLVGYSMGGAIVGQFMERSPLASRVAALVLDAPAIDWKSTLAFNASEMGLPSFTATPLEWAIGARIDADWEQLDMRNHPEAFHLPILLFHGTEDDIVPIETSDEFADELPRWVTYYRVPRAGHTQAWNVGPGLYERRLRRFMQEALKSKSSPTIESGSRN
jgi:pimeloyl-ACP methyl ester carboxylesterase